MSDTAVAVAPAPKVAARRSTMSPKRLALKLTASANDAINSKAKVAERIDIDAILDASFDQQLSSIERIALLIVKDARLIKLAHKFKPASSETLEPTGIGLSSNAYRDRIRHLEDKLVILGNAAKLARTNASKLLLKMVGSSGTAPVVGNNVANAFLKNTNRLYKEMMLLITTFGAECVNVDAKQRTLRVTLGPIVLEGINFGRFDVIIWFDKLISGDGGHPYTLEALEPNLTEHKPYVPHPHVNAGVLCEGQATNPLANSFATMHLCEAVIMIGNTLNTYNPGSPHQKIEEWYINFEKQRHKENQRREILLRRLADARVTTNVGTIPLTIPRPALPVQPPGRVTSTAAAGGFAPEPPPPPPPPPAPVAAVVVPVPEAVVEPAPENRPAEPAPAPEATPVPEATPGLTQGFADDTPLAPAVIEAPAPGAHVEESDEVDEDA
jgi:hypothetical protein